MKVYKTAKLEILGSHIIEPTIRIYREALSFVIDVSYKEKAGWLTLGGKNRCSYIEKLIHTTSDNPNPKYLEFDKKFYKMPTYLRRAIINQAIGIVNSYLALCDRYIDKKTKVLQEGKKFTHKPPRLSYNHYSFPVLYKGCREGKMITFPASFRSSNYDYHTDNLVSEVHGRSKVPAPIFMEQLQKIIDKK